MFLCFSTSRFVAIILHALRGNNLIQESFVTFFVSFLTEVLIGSCFLPQQYSPARINVFARVQYVVLGPRVKVINLNMLPESSRNELKYSLKIAFMFLSIILKFQVPDINILLGIRKKATVFDGPWSANLVLGPRLR